MEIKAAVDQAQSRFTALRHCHRKAVGRQDGRDRITAFDLVVDDQNTYEPGHRASVVLNEERSASEPASSPPLPQGAREEHITVVPFPMTLSICTPPPDWRATP